MSKHLSLYINGEWKEGRGKEFVSHNPATLDAVWQGAAANAANVEAAVKAAREASEEWSALSFDKRLAFLIAFKECLETETPSFSEALSQETGKPLWETQTEVAAMCGKIAYSVEAYQSRCATLQRASSPIQQICRHKPHGVVAVLGPFNFPGHLPNGHIIPALLAGNTVVFKPSEFTPWIGEKLALQWEKVGLPPGVFNLVQGTGEVGKMVVSSDIDGLFFTGSFSTGRALNQQLASTPRKILALEMGGNNPLVISTHSDPRAAAYMTIQSAYLTSGQRCSCARRLIVIEGKEGKAFIETLIQMIQRIRVGSYTDTPEPFMGPVISESAFVRSISKQAEWQAKGGKVLVELKPLQEKSYFLSPGLIDLTELKETMDEEVFGPLLALIRVPDFEAALREANNTTFGLTAGLISDRKEEYEYFYRKVKAGVVNWNVPLTGSTSALPFGGIGNSGNHRPSAFYAADYCAYPVASTEAEKLQWPAKLSPGIDI